jgi:SAM-dependent methyltransferase
MPSGRNYYENYWRAGEYAPPENDPLTERRVSLFLQSNGLGATVLDLGCGSGRASRVLAANGKRVTGVDISLAALERAKGGLPGVTLVACALDQGLPFVDGSFDALLCCEVIEHLVDVGRALEEMNRVLRPGGLLFLSTPFHGLLKNLALVLLGFDRHFDPLGPHVRFFSVASARRAFGRAGFHVQRIAKLGRFWPFWMDMVIYARKR